MKDKIEKLPKWAQDHIQTLERQRDAAIHYLNETLDSKTDSGVYYEDLVCTGEKGSPVVKRTYVQTHKIVFKYKGMSLDIVCYRGEIRVSYGDGAVLLPSSHKQFLLVPKDDTRI